MRSMLMAAFMTAAAATTLAAQSPTTAEKAAPAVDISRAVVATGVENREPVGVAETFTADVGTVFFYTVLEGDFAEMQVEHVWLREGEEMARVPLTVRGPRWRTWSSKRIPPDWSGKWSVQVVTGDDQVLTSVDFTVGT